MPWKASDAKKHKKGLTDSQAKKWAKIANSVLKQCKDNGGKTSECEAKAIRVANSKFSYEGGLEMKFSREKRKIPKRAMLVEDTAGIDLSKREETGTIKMDAYSGKLIKGHWLWGDLALDVQGCEVGSKRMPILEQHDIYRKIGFSNSPPNTEENKIAFDNIRLLSNEVAQEFASNVEEGFPYQASVRAFPLKIEELADGESAEVNGYKMKGPGTIFRKWQLKEASVCVFGWDSKTKVSMFAEDGDEELELDVGRYEATTLSEGETENNNPEKERDDQEGKTNTNQSDDGGLSMNLKELKEKNPELYASLMQEAKDAAAQEFKKQDDEKDQKITQLQEKVGQYEDRVKTLEKDNALRRENELRAQAESVIDAVLAKSSLPQRLQGKVKSMFSHDKYLDENEKLKVDDLKAAVEAEVKDWETGLSESQERSVHGMSNVDDDSRFSQDADAEADADRLVGYVTQGSEKTQ